MRGASAPGSLAGGGAFLVVVGGAPGDEAVVAVPGSTDPEVVAFLDTLGLRPGVRVEVREKHPFDGPLVLRVAGEDRTVSERVAQQIFVMRETQRREQSA